MMPFVQKVADKAAHAILKDLLKQNVRFRAVAEDYSIVAFRQMHDEVARVIGVALETTKGSPEAQPAAVVDATVNVLKVRSGITVLFLESHPLFLTKTELYDRLIKRTDRTDQITDVELQIEQTALRVLAEFA